MTSAPQEFLNLGGQVAVVTGGGSGIGLAVARALDRAGCRVVVAGRSRERIAAAAGGLAEAEGVPDCDVRRPQAVAALFERAVERFGRIDIVVANAGISRSSGHGRHVPQPLTGLAEEAWSEIVDTNLRGVFHCLREGARRMLVNPPRAGLRGQFVNISSARAARRGLGYGVGYCASKRAALALVEAAAAELGPLGIRVMSLMPDVVQTDLLAGTDLARHGALDPALVGRIVVDLLAQAGDLLAVEPTLIPLGVPLNQRPPRGPG